jgi:hypothetical protein
MHDPNEISWPTAFALLDPPALAALLIEEARERLYPVHFVPGQRARITEDY